MRELHFTRAGPRSSIMVATEGPLRFQLWSYDLVPSQPGHHVTWGAAVFHRTAIGNKRKTEDTFFASRAEAVDWLARQRQEAL
jgi:hypothetical protein